VELSPARREAQPEFDSGQRLLDEAGRDLYRRSADLAKMKASLEEAVGHFSRALSLHPGFAEAALGRAQAQTLLRRPSEAEKDFDRAVELLPDSAAPSLARGHLLLERYLDTISTADWRRDELPPDVDRWRAGALRDFKRARERGLEGESLLYLEASVAYAEDRLAEALERLDRLILQSPSKEEYLKLRGDVRGTMAAIAPRLQRDRVFESAIADYGRAIDLRANYHEAYRRRGELLWKTGRVEEAYADFEAGLRMDPNDSRALSDVGTYHQKTGRADLAEKFFDRAIAADATNFRAWGNRGTLKMARSDWAGARQDLEKSLQHNPNYLAATFNLAVCRARQGDADAALRQLTDIISKRDDFTLGIFTRGTLYFNLGRWAEALLDLELSVARDPQGFAPKGRPMIEECRRRIAQK
jgi:superkiller protein 3